MLVLEKFTWRARARTRVRNKFGLFMGKNEGEIEDYLKARIKELGGMSLKWVSPGFKGVPDQIVLLPNACINFVEVKAPGEEPSKLQLWVHRQLRKLGFTVHVIDTKNQVDEIYPT